MFVTAVRLQRSRCQIKPLGPAPAPADDGVVHVADVCSIKIRCAGGIALRVRAFQHEVYGGRDELAMAKFFGGDAGN